MMVTFDTFLFCISSKGTWLLSNSLGQEDWIRLNLRRVRSEELYNNFSLIAPAMLIFGIQYPWVSFMLGVANSYLVEKSYSLNSNDDHQSYKKFLRIIYLKESLKLEQGGGLHSRIRKTCNNSIWFNYYYL